MEHYIGFRACVPPKKMSTQIVSLSGILDLDHKIHYQCTFYTYHALVRHETYSGFIIHEKQHQRNH